MQSKFPKFSYQHLNEFKKESQDSEQNLFAKDRSNVYSKNTLPTKRQKMDDGSFTQKSRVPNTQASFLASGIPEKLLAISKRPDPSSLRMSTNKQISLMDAEGFDSPPSCLKR
jgi:hypothetical protein